MYEESKKEQKRKVINLNAQAINLSVTDELSIDVVGNYLFSKFIHREQISYLNEIDKIDVVAVKKQYLCVIKRMCFMEGKTIPINVSAKMIYTKNIKEVLSLIKHEESEGELLRIVDSFQIVAGKTPRPGLKLKPRRTEQ